MKHHEGQTQRETVSRETALYQALMNLESVAEYRRFFRDLCTPSELEAMADRWCVARLAERGIPYREIHDRTGVSVTTVGRVARFVEQGNGGYRLVLDRTREKDNA